MADYGNIGTSPYSKVVLDNTAITGSDTPYQIGFVGDLNTGLFRKAAGSFGLGSAGTEVANVTQTTFTVSKYFAMGVTAGLTSTGSSIAGALQLASAWNFVENGLTGSGVILPSYSAVGVGGVVNIFNSTGTALQIYGDGASTIDGVAAATGVALASAKRAQFVVKAAAKWISAQFGAVSA